MSTTFDLPKAPAAGPSNRIASFATDAKATVARTDNWNSPDRAETSRTSCWRPPSATLRVKASAPAERVNPRPASAGSHRSAATSRTHDAAVARSVVIGRTSRHLDLADVDDLVLASVTTHRVGVVPRQDPVVEVALRGRPRGRPALHLDADDVAAAEVDRAVVVAQLVAVAVDRHLAPDDLVALVGEVVHHRLLGRGPDSGGAAAGDELAGRVPDRAVRVLVQTVPDRDRLAADVVHQHRVVAREDVERVRALDGQVVHLVAAGNDPDIRDTDRRAVVAAQRRSLGQVGRPDPARVRLAPERMLAGGVDDRATGDHDVDQV